MRWLTAVDFADALRKIDIEKSRHPEQFSPAERVKDNPVRTVMRVPHPTAPDGPGLYIKRFKFKNLRRKLKHLVRPTQAAHEWRTGPCLQRHGIPTCRVLAMAARRVGLLHQEAFLITEEIPEAIPLPDYLASADWKMSGVELKHQLIEELATLVVRLLDSGHWHKDLHVGNVLIAPHRGVGERLFVLDLHSIRRGRASRRRVLRMLAMLADSTKRLGISRADRIRFLRAVLSGLMGMKEVAPDVLRRWAWWAQSAWERHDRRHMRSRTRRCVLESKEFTHDEATGYRLLRRRDFPLDAALAVVEAHGKAIGGLAGKGVVRKRGARTEISFCRCPVAGSVCVKAFLRRRSSERIKDLLRPRSRARAAWIAHRGFRVRGVPAARGLALLEAASSLSGRSDYLIMEALDVEGNLHEIAHGRLPGSTHPSGPPLSTEERRKLALAVADLFTLLAGRNVEHSDTKPSNILVAKAEGQMRLWVVDLDRARFDVEWGRGQWIKHLAQCDAGLPSQVTLLERMRCLRECGRGRWSRAERLQIARAVREKSLARGPAWARQAPGG